MKFKLYKNYKYKIIFFFIFIIFILSMSSNIKEGYKRNYRPRCNNCSYYNWQTRRCQRYCGENQKCINNYQCACADGYQWMRNKCNKCPNNLIWNGNNCVCPNGQYWTGSLCCPNGTNWNGTQCLDCSKKGQTFKDNQCVCPQGQKIKADESSCTNICEKTTVWNGTKCECPQGQKWIVSANDSETGCK